ncbi:MAG: 50S ribosomal protein L29 [Acholeplasmatales bacterium]|nr:50S ribosomal protein L29 [Acholeplasmatales bacterium]
MKDTMTKIRALSVEDINNKIAELKEELFNLKFQAALGNIEKPARISEIKRTIARLKTVLTEKQNASKAE